MPFIKVKRSGIAVGQKAVKPFRQWLNEQPRLGLTYVDQKTKHQTSVADIGWTAQDFVLEAYKRGLPLSFGTVLYWARGAQPRSFALAEVRRIFPTVKF